MRRARTGVLAVLVVACRPSEGTQSPAAAAEPAPALRSGVDAPPDLGPADLELDPASDSARAEFRFVERGVERPFGTRARVKRRPNAPGRHGPLFVAIDSPYQLFGRAASYVHVAAWRRDGRPAANADVFVGRRGVGRTDARGTLVFRHRGEDEDTPDHGLDAADLFVIDADRRCGVVEFTPYSRTAGFASDQLYVYTDRGVYRPGETVHVRVIGWHLAADYAPIEGGEVELLLRDTAGHSLAAARPVTDEFGIASADLQVPLSTEESTYELQVVYGRAKESTELQIRAYEPPVLRIEHTLPRMIGPDRDRMAFTVSAHPVDGGALRRANVRIEVTGHRGRTQSIARDVEGVGPHAFAIAGKQLATVKRGMQDGDALHFVVRVRDDHGREDALVRRVVVSANPWVGVLETDREAYAPGEPVVVVARISDLDDVALKRTEVRLAGLPGQPLRARTDDHGVARFELTMPATDTTLRLLAPELDTAIATTELAVGEVTPMQGTLGDPVVRERAKTAIVVRFPHGHVPVDRRVHMDVTDTSGALVAAAVLHANREGDAWIARGDFAVPTWGTAMLTFFALGRPPTKDGTALGLLVAGQEFAVVPDRTLQIELHGLPARAAPGETLDVRARVRDASGKNVRFAASAALVDSAVLALKDPLEVTPMDRFYDPDLRTLATTGAQMLTWPVVSRNWGDSQHDIALPPFSFGAGGDIDSCSEAWDEDDIASLSPSDAEAFGAGGLGFSGTGHGGGGTGEGVLGMASVGQPSITIRTRFPDTSLWLPNLRGDGEAKIRAKLPDRIGEQELVVVASDREGGVGIARERIVVTQPMFVEADLPELVVAGERLEIPVVVHNRTESAGDFALALATGSGTKRRASVKVAAGATGSATLELAPAKAGRVAVTIEAAGADHRDIAVEDVDVVPAGVAVPGTIAAVAKGDRTLELVVDVPEHASRVDAHLRIALPSVTSSMLALEELLPSIGDDPYALAGDLASAGILLALADRHGLATPAIERLRADARAAVAMLARVQRSDGSFAYWRNGRSSLYITAMALDAMLAARSADLPVSAKSIRAAADALGRALKTGELLRIAEVGWWEGDQARVREGITAEAFVVLARVPAELRGSDVDKALAVLGRRFDPVLDEADADVRTTAHALTAMLELGTIDPDRAKKVIARLVALRDHGHWEPTWFSAYGGTIEATTAVLEAIRLLDPGELAVETREAVRWLLSTSASWGEWHNERGTAAALRSLAAFADTKGPLPGKLEIRVDGKHLRDVGIDAKDPLGSVLALGRLDVGSWSAGRHVVELRWDEGAAPVVSLVTRTWHGARTFEAKNAGAQLRADAPDTAAPGARLELGVHVSGRRLGGATLRLARSGLVELDMVRLGALVGRGRPIAAVAIRQDAIELRLGPEVRDATLSLPYRALRRGVGKWPNVALRLRPRGTNGSAPIVVDPGPLTLR